MVLKPKCLDIPPIERWESMSLPLSLALEVLFFKLFILFIYFWLHWVFVAAHRLSLVAVCGLLIVVASLVAEHGL